MAGHVSERQFETDVVEALTTGGGYSAGVNQHYDVAQGLDTAELLAFIGGVGEGVAGVDVAGDGQGGVVEDWVEPEVFEVVIGGADEAPVGELELVGVGEVPAGERGVDRGGEVGEGVAGADEHDPPGRVFHLGRAADQLHADGDPAVVGHGPKVAPRPGRDRSGGRARQHMLPGGCGQPAANTSAALAQPSTRRGMVLMRVSMTRRSSGLKRPRSVPLPT